MNHNLTFFFCNQFNVYILGQKLIRKNSWKLKFTHIPKRKLKVIGERKLAKFHSGSTALSIFTHFNVV
jgi:hypothetical protein